MAHENLEAALRPLSRSNTWSQIRTEWDLAEVYRDDQPSTCLCGHSPILEICVIENRHIGTRAEVGNVCAKNFLGLPSDKVFSALRRVVLDIERPLSPVAIAHAHQRNWVTDWERDFYFDTCRKRVLTDRQMNKRVEINRRVLARTTRRR